MLRMVGDNFADILKNPIKDAEYLLQLFINRGLSPEPAMEVLHDIQSLTLLGFTSETIDMFYEPNG